MLYGNSVGVRAAGQTPQLWALRRRPLHGPAAPGVQLEQCFGGVLALLRLGLEAGAGRGTAVAALGGGFGLGLAKLFTLRGDPTQGLLRAFYLPRATMAAGWTLALVVGMLAGILPALSAMRLRVVDAMRRV